MGNKYIVNVSVEINNTSEMVWKAITDPNLVKEYLFGTTLVTNWKVGSPILFRGNWQGKDYEDKGIVLIYEVNNRLSYTYWSSMSGLPDKQENYSVVTMVITVKHAKVSKLSLTQDNNNTQEDANHSAENWKLVLDKLKSTAENLSSKI